MSVEIWLARTKFSSFPQNTRVYDDFSIKPASARSADGRMVWRRLLRFWLCSCPRASGRKMRTNRVPSLWLCISILGALSLSPVLSGQDSPSSKAAVPATTDWSQHHVIFSSPGTAEQTKRVERDHRYWQQLARRAPARLSTAEPDAQKTGAAAAAGKKQSLKRDWSQDLGTGATIGATNYPAKFSFDSTTANCTSDF